jgi:p21-activated kinase 1
MAQQFQQKHAELSPVQPPPQKPKKSAVNPQPQPNQIGKTELDSKAPPQKIRARPKAASSTEEVIAKLKAICNPGDPTRLYKSLVKIGQGASGGVYLAKNVESGYSVAIKQMNLEEQPKKDLIINEILVMKAAQHKNIVNFIDSFLYGGDLWVVMEMMEGGSLTDTVTSNFMTEDQIATVCREVMYRIYSGIGRPSASA